MRVGVEPATEPADRSQRSTTGELWAGRAVVVFVILCAVLTLAVSGDGPTRTGVATTWQLLDIGTLSGDPIGSVWFLHNQPPLHNLLVGLVGWLPVPFAGSLLLLYAGALVLTGLLLHDLLVRWNTRALPAGVLTAVAMANPALLSTVRMASYEVPVAMVVVAGLWSAQRYLDAPSPRRLMVVSAVLTTGMLTHSLVHPVVVLPILALTVLARPVRRRVALAALALPVLLVGGWLLKNQLVFGQPALASWSGFTLQRGVVGPMEAGQVRRDVANGVASPLALEAPWGELDYYGPDRAGVGVCRPRHDHPAVADALKESASEAGRTVPNYNSECYLGLYDQARADARVLALEHPLRFWTTRDAGLVLAYDTAAGCFGEPCTWMDRLYHPLLVKLDGEVSMDDWNLPLLESGPRDVEVTLAMLLVVTSAAVGWRGGVAAWRLVRLRRRGEEWPTNEVVWLYAAMAVVGVIGGSTLIEFGENARFRAALDPLLLTLPAAAALRALARARAAQAAGMGAAVILGDTRRVTGETPAVRRTGETPAIRTTGETPAVRRTGETPAVRRTGETPAIRTTGETPAVRTTGETPAVRRTGEIPAVRTTGETPAVRRTGETPAVRTTGETPAVRRTGETPTIRTTGETPAVPGAAAAPVAPMGDGGEPD